MPFKIVVLDGIYANPGDLSWDALKPYGQVAVYDRTAPQEVIDRAKGADLIIINKIRLDAPQFDALPDLKAVIISATGMDNVDLKEAEKRNILVKNVVGYSTASVTQHTFAMILSFTNQAAAHNDKVQAGAWDKTVGFSFTLSAIPALSGKTLGIYGFGAIGQEVAKVGHAFGMKIAVVSKHASEKDYPAYKFITLNELFETSDIVSLHAPLRADNESIVDEKLLGRMKPNSILVNTARGGLINESALRAHLLSHPDCSAALDVLRSEPPGSQYPLLGLSNCLITPHLAWTSQQARRLLIEGVVAHVGDFAKGR